MMWKYGIGTVNRKPTQTSTLSNLQQHMHMINAAYYSNSSGDKIEFVFI